MKYHKAKRRLPKCPNNLFGHAIGSAVVGYLFAWLGIKLVGGATASHLSALAQGVVNRTCGTHLHFPVLPVVWAMCGLAIFCWPYLQLPFAYLRTRRNIARLQGIMLSDLHLTLKPAEDNCADLARYAESFRAKE